MHQLWQRRDTKPRTLVPSMSRCIGSKTREIWWKWTWVGPGTSHKMPRSRLPWRRGPSLGFSNDPVFKHTHTHTQQRQHQQQWHQTTGNNNNNNNNDEQQQQERWRKKFIPLLRWHFQYPLYLKDHLIFEGYIWVGFSAQDGRWNLYDQSFQRRKRVHPVDQSNHQVDCENRTIILTQE